MANPSQAEQAEQASSSDLKTTGETRDILWKCYESYRAQVQHEDTLLNQRTTWVVMSQAFLLGSYVFLSNNPNLFVVPASTDAVTMALPGANGVEFGVGSYLLTIEVLRAVFQSVGFLASVLVSLSARAAIFALADLAALYNRSIVEIAHQHPNNVPYEAEAEEKIVYKVHQAIGLPPFSSSPMNRKTGLLASAFLGPLFALAWLVLFVANYFLSEIGRTTLIILGIVIILIAFRIAFKLTSGKLWKVPLWKGAKTSHQGIGRFF